MLGSTLTTFGTWVSSHNHLTRVPALFELLLLDFSFDLCIINSRHHATPKMSIFSLSFSFFILIISLFFILVVFFVLHNTIGTHKLISWFCSLALPSRFIMKMGQTRPLFVYFRSFHMTNKAQILTINEKSIDGVLWTQTRGGRMVGTDKSTELWARFKQNILQKWFH